MEHLDPRERERERGTDCSPVPNSSMIPSDDSDEEHSTNYKHVKRVGPKSKTSNLKRTSTQRTTLGNKKRRQAAACAGNVTSDEEENDDFSASEEETSEEEDEDSIATTSCEESDEDESSFPSECENSTVRLPCSDPRLTENEDLLQTTADVCVKPHELMKLFKRTMLAVTSGNAPLSAHTHAEETLTAVQRFLFDEDRQEFGKAELMSHIYKLMNVVLVSLTSSTSPENVTTLKARTNHDCVGTESGQPAEKEETLKRIDATLRQIEELREVLLLSRTTPF
jgi:hypothetical protein